eukprot:CAMPEP_0175144186 /NCGR_PEP_ID=MMETSP0087-20121206/13966_1 /TAXON_ID=136419 /ORGANISM="Unknown Unknown, Strain D1" /LENGTH=218 /DNA_ID=CAMNT_0016428575 /DNA_START=86 /DNA_END=742 /DNA_ORIENTATION=+
MCLSSLLLLGSVVATEQMFAVEQAYFKPNCEGDLYRVEATPAGLCRESFNKKGSTITNCVDGKVVTEMCTDQKCQEGCKPLPHDPNICSSDSFSSSKHVCTSDIKAETFFGEGAGYVSSSFYNGDEPMCFYEDLRDVVMRPTNKCIPFASGSAWERYTCKEGVFVKESFFEEGCDNGKEPYETIEHTTDNCKRSLYDETVHDVCQPPSPQSQKGHQEL